MKNKIKNKKISEKENKHMDTKEWNELGDWDRHILYICI